METERIENEAQLEEVLSRPYEATSELLGSIAPATPPCPPAVSLQQMLSQVLDWLSRGMKTLEKPTKFQVRDGKF